MLLLVSVSRFKGFIMFVFETTFYGSGKTKLFSTFESAKRAAKEYVVCNNYCDIGKVNYEGDESLMLVSSGYVKSYVTRKEVF